jgi:hypothetical protein
MISETPIVDVVSHLPVRLLPLPAGSKKATLAGWQDAATDNADQIALWSQSRCNWGAVPKLGVFVLDVDHREGRNGFATLADLEEQFGKLPDTLSVHTPSGGQHRYFAYSPDYGVRTTSDPCGLAGLDFRCPSPSAGYVVMPPSRTSQGAYTWVNWDGASDPHIAQAPQWLVHLACGADPRTIGQTRKKIAKIAEPVEDPDEEDPNLLEHLRDAIQHLDCNDYDSWIAAGQALKSLDDPEAMSIWLEWSAQYDGFDPAEAQKKWEGFHPSRTSYKAVFAKAQAAGWVNPGRPRNKVAEAVAEFNKTHAVVIAGGSVCILREGTSERGGAAINFMAPHALATLYANRSIRISKVDADGETKTKSVRFTSVWLEHPDRRTHEGVTFAPSGKVPSTYFNLWRGYAVEPIDATIWQSARACRRFLHHLRTNICKGNRRDYRYLLGWLANMFQDPDNKPGVAVVLRGKKGTGKSKVADILRHILGGHAFKASKSEHIVGRFSSHLADKLLLVAEESFFAGGKADTNTLKDLVTSNTITCEQKHIPAFEMRSCHRVIMVTNSAWAVPASEDERRFFVLDVGEEHMQDHAYFASIDREMLDGDGCRAFLRLLQRLDISGLNMRDAPKTAALAIQKQLSLEPHDMFVLDALQSEELLGCGWVSGEPAYDPAKGDVYAAYVDYCRSMHVRPLANNRFSPIFEERLGCVSYQEPAGQRRRKYELPRLEDARRRFAKALGIPPIE